MLSKPFMLVLRVWRKLWVRVLFGAVLALAAVLAAPLLNPVIPDDWKDRFGADAVLPILNILATTMLTVTTFSLSVMVQAFRTASGQATPRAYRLHLTDTTTHTVLAIFTGAFLFSLTAIVLFRSGYYSDTASVVIFGATILVIAAIVLAILRWIEHLSRLGSMDNTLDMVQRHAEPPLRAAMERPSLGGVPVAPDADLPPGARPVTAPRGGYVQFIDMRALDEKMSACNGRLRIARLPGHHVTKGAPLAFATGDADFDDLAECFTLGSERTAEQDARFGVLVLNEIAVRALSPGINDPGTAIDVIQRLTRILTDAGRPGEADPDFMNVQAPAVTGADLVEDAFHTLIRDGASRPEVMGVLLDALSILSRSDWDDLADAAREAHSYALRHAEAALTVEDDRARLSADAKTD